MTKFDSPGATVPPPRATPQVETSENETVTLMHPPVHLPFGRTLVDKMTDYVGTPLHKVTPLFGNAYDNGAQLRTILGNVYFILPAAAVYLGVRAFKDTHGLAVPPVLWLTLVKV